MTKGVIALIRNTVQLPIKKFYSMDELIAVLSVWWIKVVIDCTIVYAFIRITRDKK